jgi:hypothetical protein
MTAALRPVRPAGHRATCDCEPCASYWAAAFRFEVQVRRREHERIENELLAAQTWAAPQKLRLVGDGLDENPEVAALWLDAFRRAWERQETIGFNLQDARAVWADKDAAFRESVEQTQRRIDQQQDERHPTPELESGKQRRLQRQIKRLRALARSPVPAEAERAAALADELQVKLDAMGAQA